MSSIDERIQKVEQILKDLQTEKQAKSRGPEYKYKLYPKIDELINTVAELESRVSTLEKAGAGAPMKKKEVV